MAVAVARIRARVETDLLDPELEALIADARQAVVERVGPDRDAGAPLVVTIDGDRRRLDVTRPIDAAEDVEVVEYLGSVLGESQTTLDAADYRIRNGGRTLERIYTGPNPRLQWGTRADVTYVPVDDQAQRDEVVVKLVMLAIEYAGVAERSVGDTMTRHVGQGVGTFSYHGERAQLLASLSPRKGLLLA